MELRGPCKYNKKDDKFNNLRSFEIVDASFEHLGKVIPIQENNIHIERKSDSFFIHHSFIFTSENGSVAKGSWSIAEFPLDAFKTMDKNILRVIIYGELSTAIFRIFFTEKIADELKLID